MNHCIVFPMNGPMECLKKVPCVDEKYRPQVTFLGARDEWMKKAGKYKYLYKMDTEIAYNWLQVWVDANHPSFKNCIIDTSDNVRDDMNHITEIIIEEAIMTTDLDIIAFHPCWMPRMKKIQKECVTTQFILQYYQNHSSLMQTSIQQLRPCWT